MENTGGVAYCVDRDLGPSLSYTDGGEGLSKGKETRSHENCPGCAAV